MLFKDLKRALGLIILSVIVFSQGKAAVTVPVLSNDQIDSICRLAGIEYEPILKMFQAGLTEEKISEFARVLESKRHESPDSAKCIVLSGNDAVIFEYVENIGNLPWQQYMNVLNYQYRPLGRPINVPKACAAILSKWLNTNAKYLIRQDFRQDYIHYASIAYLICAAYQKCGRFIYSHLIIGNPQFDFYTNILTSTTECVDGIEKLQIDFYQQSISDNYDIYQVNKCQANE